MSINIASEITKQYIKYVVDIPSILNFQIIIQVWLVKLFFIFTIAFFIFYFRLLNHDRIII